VTEPQDPRGRAREIFWVVATSLGKAVIGFCIVLATIIIGLLGLCLFVLR